MTALLADENVPRPTVLRLRGAGFDVVHISEDHAGIRDEEVLALTRSQRRIILIVDRDFGELIFLHGRSAPPAIIYLRMPMPDPDAPAVIVIDLLSRRGWVDGYFVTVTRHGFQRRRLP